MYERVNPSHPDLVMDRVAGAIVDLAYTKHDSPRIAVEGLLGHGWCDVIIETSVPIYYKEIENIVKRITKDNGIKFNIQVYAQDPILASNQNGKIRCGDNGVFKGMPMTQEQKRLIKIAKEIYDLYPYDGKYILDGDKLIICQSNMDDEEKNKLIKQRYSNAIINPLGHWTGGPNVDTGAVNRKLGSDMGDSVTGGGLMGKSFDKADVSINIYAFIKAQQTGKPVEISCAIGDEIVDGRPYSEIVEIARQYINRIGGFEKFAEEGLLRYEYELEPEWYKAYNI